jgi:hypothetical protein
MAQQKSFLKFKGNIGDLTFYKHKEGFMVREKGGVSKERIMSDPKYARTRENMKEFAEAASGVKLLKDSIRPAIIRTADSKVHRRLQHIMVKVVKSDPINPRGERKVTEGNWDLLRGLQLNEHATLKKVLRKHVVVSNTPESLTISVPEFNPADFLLAPEGTTNYRIYLLGGSMAIGTEDYALDRVDSPLQHVKGLSPALTLTLDKTTLIYGHKVYVLGVEFIQMVNGVEAMMNDSSYNAATFILTEIA